jgi:hypothetical protein
VKRCNGLQILIFFIFMSSVFASDEPVQVNVKTDKTRINVGDALTLEISTEAPRDIRIVFPDELNLKPFEVLDRHHEIEPGTTKNTIKEKLIVKASIYEVGDFEIPPVQIDYETKSGEKNTVSTESVFIRVDSIITKETGSPRDLKPPLSVTPSLWYVSGFIAAVLASLVLALLLIKYIRRHRRRKKELPPPPSPPRPAHEIALEALAELRQKRYLETGQIKVLFVELTDIIKSYVGFRYGFSALERTTGEIKKDLKKITIRDQDRLELMSFLELADLVKFAKFFPQDSVSVKLIDQSEEFIRRTMDKPVPLSEEPSINTGVTK